MSFRTPVALLSVSFSFLTSSAHAQVLERDPQNNFSISRPVAWVHQEKPFPAVRVMLGIEGDGYGGNCNITVLPSPSTAKMTQSEVDASENKRSLGIAFWQRGMPNVTVLSAVQRKRGAHFGHLMNYSDSYMSPALQKRVHVRAELFSHSRPGKVFAFTCTTVAFSPADAQRAFSAEGKSFEALSASLRVDP